MYNGEFFKLRDSANGRVYFTAPTALVSMSGIGMPPIAHNVVRAPFQHGVSFDNFYLQPRLVTLTVVLDACSREHLWRLRQNLIELLNPRVGALQLELHYPDGRIMALHDVYYDAGAEGDLGTSGSPRQQRLALRFQVDDPVWFGERRELLWAEEPIVITELVFPATFPIIFHGATHISDLKTVTINGTWPAYPTITLTGPMTSPAIHNLSTGAVLQLNTSIARGEVVTIRTLFPHRSVVSSTRGNIYWALTPESVMMDFYLQPNRESGEDTQLQVSAFGTGADSNVHMEWYERWIGV